MHGQMCAGRSPTEQTGTYAGLIWSSHQAVSSVIGGLFIDIPRSFFSLQFSSTDLQSTIYLIIANFIYKMGEKIKVCEKEITPPPRIHDLIF
jgi:hypothetical protein